MSVQRSAFDSVCLNTTLSSQYSIYHHNQTTPQHLQATIIDPTIPGNRLYENENGEIILIPKSPAEVVGEVILRPLIDTVANLGSKIFSVFSIQTLSNATNSCWTYAQSFSLPKFPSLIPMASAQPLTQTCDVVEFDSPCENQMPQMIAYSPITPERLSSTLVSLGHSEEEIQTLLSKVQDSPEKETHELTALTTQIFESLLSDSKIDWRAIDQQLLIQLRDSNGLTLFQSVVKNGKEELVQYLLTTFRGTDVLYGVDRKGRNAVHIAAIEGYQSMIPLLSQFFPLDTKDQDGLTPLHWAIHEGRFQVVEALIKQGASLATSWTTPDGVEISPLSMVIASGNSDTLSVLLKQDTFQEIDLLQATPHIGTALHVAIRANQAPMLEYILQSQHVKTKHLLEHKDPFGRTPLQLAAYLGDLNAIYLLHKNGADLNKGEGEKGGTAVHYAVLGENPETIQLLDYLEAHLSSTNAEGQTPLSIAKQKNTPSAKECEALLTRLPRIDRRDKTRPPNFNRRPPINLVFRGGGPKGIAYVGAIQQLESLNALKEVRRVAGTSAGAITAALLAVGYDSQSLQQFLERDFMELLDHKGHLEKKLVELAKNPSKSKAFQTLLSEYWEGWGTVLHPIKRAKQLYTRLSDITGLCSGEELRNWLDELIQKATISHDHPLGIAHCTFGELEELIHKYPEKYKELHVFSLKLNSQGSEVMRFSHEDPRWKDLIISDAIRASLSIPGVFEPHTLHFKDVTGDRHPRSDHGQFIDGGLVRNFPLDAFDEQKYQEDRYYRGEKTNRRTLGFSLQEVGEFANIEPLKTIESGQELVKAVVLTYFHAEEILSREKVHNQDRTVTIPVNIGLLDFNVEQKVKSEMVKNGTEAVKFFLNAGQN